MRSDESFGGRTRTIMTMRSSVTFRPAERGPREPRREIRSGPAISARRRVGRRGWRFAVLLALPLVLVSTNTRADISVVRGASTLTESSLATEAEIEIDLSGDPLEALASGIPLSFAVEMILFRTRNWLPDEKIAQWQHLYELSFHALSGRYIVRAANAATNRSFRTVSEALAALGDFATTWEKQGVFPSDPDSRYEMELRARLALETQPMPIQLMSHWRRSWRSNSGWNRWPVTR